MAVRRMELLEEPGQVRGALAPVRRRLLVRLRTPASASELAREFGLTRQKVNYHLRRLEDAGLIELAEERRRRGFVERVMRATAGSYVVDPSLLAAAGDPAARPVGEAEKADDATQDPGEPQKADDLAQAPPGDRAEAGIGDQDEEPLPPLPAEYVRAADRHSATRLVAVASAAVRDVTRMQAAADRADRRLLTFTLESEVRLAEPADLHRFTEALAGAVADVIARFHAETGRLYRVIGAGHPAPATQDPTPAAQAPAPDAQADPPPGGPS
ncbi:transcriptional regulator [Sphaerisporangium krabiense]|uniref:DNA-binding transcriptional ArsR family regulator n=2 Tax=Sphaerisporangium krabiense TaxID=763782 RepID=A0A7W8ZB07_9ACTN|nr:DNA-binding transcriptional ArsR family regulator [Sphaerisporangium krabiense]GII67415.1 transcriptional regulator [Sphaerisporangium krabiense]